MNTEQLSGQDVLPPLADGEGPDEFDLEMDQLASAMEPPVDTAAGDGTDPSEAPGATDTLPAPAQPEARQDPVAGDPPPAGEPSTDVWANAPAALREAHEAALRDADVRFGRLRGKLSHADRQLAQLRAEQGGGVPAGGQEQGAVDTAQPATDPFESEAIKKLREDYGEVAGPLVDLIQTLSSEVKSLKAPVQQIGQERYEAELGAQATILADQHPDYEACVNDPRYSAWAETQPKMIREAIARNAQAIVDGEDAAMVIGLYKAAIGAGASPPPPPPPPPPADPQPNTLEQRRQRQLDAGRDAGGRGNTPTTSGVPEDIDSAMDFYIAKAERRGRL